MGVVSPVEHDGRDRPGQRGQGGLVLRAAQLQQIRCGNGRGAQDQGGISGVRPRICVTGFCRNLCRVGPVGVGAAQEVGSKGEGEGTEGEEGAQEEAETKGEGSEGEGGGRTEGKGGWGDVKGQ